MRPGAVVVDATLGLGGHSEALLTRYPEVRLVGLDRDTAALELAGRRLAEFSGRTLLVHAVYDELPQVLADAGIPSVDGILFDLGVSSMQLDEAERGFAYSQDAPLDMRMDQSRGITAADVMNTYSGKEIARVRTAERSRELSQGLRKDSLRTQYRGTWRSSLGNDQGTQGVDASVA